MQKILSNPFSKGGDPRIVDRVTIKLPEKELVMFDAVTYVDGEQIFVNGTVPGGKITVCSHASNFIFFYKLEEEDDNG